MIRQLAAVSLFAALAFSAAALGQSKEATPTKPEPAKTAPAAQEAKFAYVRLTTSAGDITLELNETLAPITVKNFLAYVDKGFYSGTIFHRVIANFMIQGGGFSTDWKQKPTDPAIKNEWKNGLKNARYTIAMARTNQPDSATSQFFINTVDNAGLDRQQADGAAYCVFGRVVDGTDTVDKIKAGKVVPQPLGNEPSKPVEPVEIKSAKRLTPEESAKYSGKPAADKPKDEPKKDEKKEEKKDGK